jgi:hypothetical protein
MSQRETSTAKLLIYTKSKAKNYYSKLEDKSKFTAIQAWTGP